MIKSKDDDRCLILPKKCGAIGRMSLFYTYFCVIYHNTI